MSLLKKDVNKLLRKIKDGDRGKAIADLFELTYTPLLLIATKALGNDSDSDDILNETYMIILEKINEFDDTKDGFNWICKIVENTAKNFRNKINSLKEDVFNEENIGNKFSEDTFYENCEIFYLFKCLTDDEKDLITRRFLNLETLQEISDDMNIPVSTLHRKIKKIIKKFKKFSKNEKNALRNL